MLERTRARRQALQLLYQREITEQSVGVILDDRSYSDEDGEPSEYARELALGTEGNGAVIDAEIEATSQHWSLMRMPFVDRNILRLAVYEILFEPEVPDSVAINEAVEMAKAYGTDDSPKFVNGVLGRIAEVHGGAQALPPVDDCGHHPPTPQPEETREHSPVPAESGQEHRGPAGPDDERGKD